MKISIVMGFFLPVPPLAGGATEKVWSRLAELMAEAGHDVTVFSRRWPGLPEEESAGRLRHVRLTGFRHTRWLPLNLALDLAWGWRVARKLPAADVVVCHTVALPVYLRRFKPAAGRVAVVLGRMPKGQVRFYGGVDLLLASSEAVATAARRELPRHAARIQVYPYAIDWMRHARASRQATAKPPLTIGYVGRIHPEKGLDLLLEAAVQLAATPKLPPWRLELIGPVSVPQGGGGEAYRDALLTRFQSRLGDRLALRPPQFDPAELARSYGGLDIFCYPSLAERGETFGVAIAEAMAAGAAPVVSDLACFRDLVTEGQTGLVFDHRAPDAASLLANALAGLLADHQRRRAIAAAAKTQIRRFDFPAVATHLLAELARLTASDGTR